MLDPNYIIAPSPEQYYVDKTTGAPLSGGKVFFYSDTNRSDLKKIYTLSGVAPNYSYVELPNPTTLSGVGTFQDEDGNNVIPYYYPYDADGNVELYFLDVYDSNDVPQFTREAWPNFISNSSTGDLSNDNNFIPNGQFLAHINIPADPTLDLVSGEVRSAVTQVAQGGWTFERPNDSTANDNIQFFRYPEYVENPTASPRYAIQLECLLANPGDSFKDLRIKFSDVNKFASDTQLYTLSFSGITFNSGNFQIPISIIKNYGSGGSTTTVTSIGTATITGAQTTFNLSFSFGSNSGKTIGTQNDDYVQLALSFPTNIGFGCQLTDFLLMSGELVVTSFPTITDREFMAQTLVPPTPNPDSSNLYLPVVLTKDGLGYDSSQIGNVEMDSTGSDTYSGSLSTTTNRMLADGNGYLTQVYSSLGIPFSRLQAKYWIPSINQNRYGTGPNFVAAAIQAASTSNILLATNKFGTAVPSADGTSATGFTFFNVCPDSSAGFNMRANQLSSTELICISTTYGNVSDPGAGTSGFTISTIYNASNAPSELMFNLTTVAATGLAGLYWTFHVNPTNTSYYMWFTVDGSGVDPAPGGTGIQVDLKSSYTAADMATIVSRVLAGCQIDVITTAAASTLTGGDFFTFTAVGGQKYAVWYSINGVGTAPTGNGIPIQVALLSADTAAAVATKTTIAVNSFMVATPNYQGAFLRGFDPNSVWDVDSPYRSSFIPSLYGNVLGTLEIDTLRTHNHAFTTYQQGNGKASGADPPTVYSNQFQGSGTAEYGFSENKPVNYNVQYLIRY